MKNINKALISISLCAVLFSPLAMAASSKPAKSEKTNNSFTNRSVPSNEKLRGYQQPEVDINTHSEVHKIRVEKAASNLKEIAETRANLENVDVIETLEDVSGNLVESSDEVSGILQEVEEQPAWKSYLLGTDYKNLGQLRSSLVQNRNQIRSLNRILDQVSSEETKSELQTQIETLTQERERVKDIISQEEGKFSLLGWVAKMFSGYTQEALDTEEETEFIDEVEEVLGIKS